MAPATLASTGWFIGMMFALAMLLLILVLVCIIKRNRGGKYAVHEREATHGRKDFSDDAGFHEYSQPYVPVSLSLSLSPLSPLSVIQLRLFISYLTFPNRVGSSRTHSKASLGSEAKMPPPESDTDSMAEYGDGETGNSSILRPTFAFIPKFKKTLLSRNAVHVT